MVCQIECMYCFTTNQENLLARMGNRLIDLAKRRRTEKGKRIAEGNESIQNSPSSFPLTPSLAIAACLRRAQMAGLRVQNSAPMRILSCKDEERESAHEETETRKKALAKFHHQKAAASGGDVYPHVYAIPFPPPPQMSVSLSWVSSPPPYAHPWHACFSKGEKKKGVKFFFFFLWSVAALGRG